MRGWEKKLKAAREPVRRRLELGTTGCTHRGLAGGGADLGADQGG
jgi:hypothetical protein